MRIMHVVNSLSGGGAENMVVALAWAQQRAGHCVTVTTINAEASAYEEQMHRRLNEGGVAFHNTYRRRGSLWSTMAAAASLGGVLRRYRPDVVNTHLELAHTLTGLAHLAYAALPGRKWRHVVTIHSAPERWAFPCTCLNCRTPVIFCSEAARQARAGLSSRAAVIRNGVAPPDLWNNSAMTKSSLTRSLGLSEQATLILSVESLHTDKNYPVAIRAFAQASRHTSRDLHYIVCGQNTEATGAARHATEELRVRDRVHFLGLRSDARDIMAVADCYLSASVREGLPLAVLEALFAGLPCVLSPIPAHRDIAAGVPGCHVAEFNEPESLAGELIDALDRRYDTRRLVQLREPLLRDYGIERCAREYLAFYESLL
jgi:glycosyltransferase involved in cell wall biosynthesis